MQRRSSLLAELVALLAWWGYCALALRALEPQALGFLALLVAAHQLARVLLEFGATPALALRLERSPEKERELLGLGLGLRVRGLLLLLPLVGVWALLEEGGDPRQVLGLFALALLREPARVYAPSLALRGSSAEGALPRLASRLVLLALAACLHFGEAPALAWSAAATETAAARTSSSCWTRWVGRALRGRRRPRRSANPGA